MIVGEEESEEAEDQEEAKDSMDVRPQVFKLCFHYAVILYRVWRSLRC